MFPLLQAWKPCYITNCRTYLIYAVIVGEVANFVAYIYAPAVMVTPLGALSIIVRYIVLVLL